MSPSTPLGVHLRLDDRVSAHLDRINELLDAVWAAFARLDLKQRLEDRRRERELVRQASLLRPSRLDWLKCRLFGHPGFAAKVTYQYIARTGRLDPVDVSAFGDTNKRYLMGPREGWHRLVGRRRCGACGDRA